MIHVGGTSYRTEIDGFDGISGDAANGFTVIKKSGMAYQYGKTSDSRAHTSTFGANKVLIWAVNRMTDVNGNEVNFTYNNDSYGHYITGISYAGGACSLDFAYETRTDQNPRYLNGKALYLEPVPAE